MGALGWLTRSRPAEGRPWLVATCHILWRYMPSFFPGRVHFWLWAGPEFPENFLSGLFGALVGWIAGHRRRRAARVWLHKLTSLPLKPPFRPASCSCLPFSFCSYVPPWRFTKRLKIPTSIHLLCGSGSGSGCGHVCRWGRAVSPGALPCHSLSQSGDAGIASAPLCLLLIRPCD